MELSKILENIEPEAVLMELGVDYRLQQGSGGEQLNVRECPRCRGDKWKVYLNAESGLGNCFHGSCVGEPGFNIYTFTRECLDETNGGTVEFFNNYATGMGWRVHKKPLKEKSTMATIPEIIMPTSDALPHEGRMINYLIDRGYTAKIAERLQWRYCRAGMGEYVINPGTDLEIEQNYGQRVILPVHDLNGDLVTFQGRDITGEAKSKYLFPSGLPGSGKFLYGGNLLKSPESLIVVEGALDVASVIQKLDMPVIGTFGVSISHGSETGDDQLGRLLKLKRQGLRRINLMWDGERAAVLKAIKPALLLKSVGFDVKLCILADDKDPGDASREEMLRALDEGIQVTKLAMIKLRAKLMSGDSLPQMKPLTDSIKLITSN